MPAREAVLVAKTSMLSALVNDFADGPDGSVQGLTRPELAYAWRARHGSTLPQWVVRKASQKGQIDLYPVRRTCDVSGKYRRAWVPIAYMPRRKSCS